MFGPAMNTEREVFLYWLTKKNDGAAKRTVRCIREINKLIMDKPFCELNLTLLEITWSLKYLWLRMVRVCFYGSVRDSLRLTRLSQVLSASDKQLMRGCTQRWIQSSQMSNIRWRDTQSWIHFLSFSVHPCAVFPFYFSLIIRDFH